VPAEKEKFQAMPTRIMPNKKFHSCVSINKTTEDNANRIPPIIATPKAPILPIIMPCKDVAKIEMISRKMYKWEEKKN